MVKLLAVLIILCAIGGGAYLLFATESKPDVEVTGKIQVSKQYTNQVKDAEAAEQPFMAVVKGKVKNNTNKPLENVFIKYSIDGRTTSATIFNLGPGQQADFNTRGIETAEKNVSYEYEGIQYDETSL